MLHSQNVLILTFSKDSKIILLLPISENNEDISKIICYLKHNLSIAPIKK